MLIYQNWRVKTQVLRAQREVPIKLISDQPSLLSTYIVLQFPPGQA